VRNDLALRRAAHGWSQERLAEQLDVSRQTIISIEKGRYDPSLKLAVRMAQLFGCRIEDIFDDLPNPLVSGLLPGTDP